MKNISFLSFIGYILLLNSCTEEMDTRQKTIAEIPIKLVNYEEVFKDVNANTISDTIEFLDGSVTLKAEILHKNADSNAIRKVIAVQTRATKGTLFTVSLDRPFNDGVEPQILMAVHGQIIATTSRPGHSSVATRFFSIYSTGSISKE